MHHPLVNPTANIAVMKLFAGPQSGSEIEDRMASEIPPPDPG